MIEISQLREKFYIEIPLKSLFEFSTISSLATLVEEKLMEEAEEDEDEDVPIESLIFNMEWDDEAKNMLEQVPSPFRKVAVENTENYAKEHSSKKVTIDVFDAFRKELGM